MKEEDIIRRKCGSKNPFEVPEGYFENFTANLMSKLPESETPAPQVRAFPWYRLHKIGYAAAAVLCGVMLFSTIHFISHQKEPSSIIAQQPVHSETETITDDVYIEDALDYAMVSNHEIAQYLTDVY